MTFEEHGPPNPCLLVTTLCRNESYAWQGLVVICQFQVKCAMVPLVSGADCWAER
jgi:hypothetical protein